MKVKKYSEEQIIGALQEADAGAKVEDVCRRLGISARTGQADRPFRAMPITCSGQGDHPGRDAAG